MRPMNDAHASKAIVRRKLLTVRDALSKPDLDKWSAKIAAQLLTSVPYQDHQVFSGYWPIGNEVDVRPLMTMLNDKGLHGSLPVVVGEAEPLGFCTWSPGEPLVSAGFGTKQPKIKVEVVPTLILMPLLGFTRFGDRLGFGAGFYDRTLKELRSERDILAVGVAFSVQELQDLATEPHDERLDWIVTEKEAIKF